MLRIWGLKSAANAQKVTWCLGEVGVPYEHVEVNAVGRNREDREYLMVQGHIVPIMDDDGFMLWEAHAIVRYLAEKYGSPPLWPRTVATRADAARWMDYQLTTIRPLMHTLMRGKPDSDQVARISRNMTAAMEVVERALERRPYLAGDDFTIGDIPLGIMVFRWSVLAIEKPAMPAIDAWFERLRGRAAFRMHVEAFLPEGSFTPVKALQQ